PNIPLARWGPADPGFTGGRSVFINAVGPNTILTLQRSGGGTFDLLSIDLGQFRPGPVLNGNVPFVGVRADGSTVSQTFQLPFTPMGQPVALETFTFTGFTDLTSVSWEGGPGATLFEHFHQFGNIVLRGAGGPPPVPGPPPRAGFAVGPAGRAGYAGRKRRPRTGGATAR